MRAAEIPPPKCWAERGKFLVALLQAGYLPTGRLGTSTGVPSGQ